IRYVAGDGLGAQAVRGEIDTVDADQPGGGEGESGQDPDGRRFPGTIRSQKAVNLATRDGQRDVVDRGEIAVALRQVPDFNHPRLYYPLPLNLPRIEPYRAMAEREQLDDRALVVRILRRERD